MLKIYVCFGYCYILPKINSKSCLKCSHRVVDAEIQPLYHDQGIPHTNDSSIIEVYGMGGSVSHP